MKTSTTSTTRSRRGVVLVCLLALCSAGADAAESALPPEPRETIQATIDQVLGILRDKSLKPGQRRAELEKIADARFDFRTMSRLVMGRNWKRLGPEQRDEFEHEFKTYLANDYGSRIERYDQEDVVVLGEEPRPRGDVVVATRISGGRNDGALVDYRMRNRDGHWRIIDVVIEGISLVANFRDQFREVVSHGGPQDLLRKLREKNAEQREAVVGSGGSAASPPQGRAAR